MYEYMALWQLMHLGTLSSVRLEYSVCRESCMTIYIYGQKKKWHKKCTKNAHKKFKCIKNNLKSYFSKRFIQCNNKKSQQCDEPASLSKNVSFVPSIFSFQLALE